MRLDEERDTPDPDAEQEAAAGARDQADDDEVPVEELDKDPAHNPDDPGLKDLKGG